MLQRGGAVVIRMLEDVQPVTIGPLIERTIAKGSVVYTDEYDIDSRWNDWGYDHETVCHAAGEFARDDDGDGSCEVHVNTLEGFWSLLRSWLRPHRGIAQEKLPLYLGFFEFVHNVRARGKALLGELIGLLVSSPRIPTWTSPTELSLCGVLDSFKPPAWARDVGPAAPRARRLARLGQ
jgi:transposase